MWHNVFRLTLHCTTLDKKQPWKPHAYTLKYLLKYLGIHTSFTTTKKTIKIHPPHHFSSNSNIMASTHTPVSDDDFDLIPNADAVSDVSDEPQLKQHRDPPSHNPMGAGGTLAGPHEVPQMPPYEPEHDDGITSIAQRLSENTIEDSHRDTGIAKGSGNLVNEGLKYGKSVYNSFRGKNAVIAVMGYVYLLITAQTLLRENRMEGHYTDLTTE